MLQSLSIKNYAIIKSLDIDFDKGLQVITGETGAGKSILIGALNLILGQRAESSIIADKAQKCTIEAIFVADDLPQVQSFFLKHSFDLHDNELIIRREIATGGKSRAFINDTPASLAQLKELASMLVDLHQQFEVHELNEKNVAIGMIDALAANKELNVQMKQQFEDWQKESKSLDVMKDQLLQAQKEMDYNKFLLNELDEANFSTNEIENLEEELQVLTHAESIKSALQQAIYVLSEGEQPMVQQIKSVMHSLSSFKDINKQIQEISERLQQSFIELNDIAGDMERLDSKVMFDAERISLVQDRISLGNKLLKKHNVKDTDALVNIQQSLSDAMFETNKLEAAIETTEKKVSQLEKLAMETAKALHKSRMKVIPSFEKNTAALLHKVGMPGAAIKIEVSEAALSQTGVDDIVLLFDANKSGRFEPLHKVASGGERSRLMLCIKSQIAREMKFPTLIFDEIDAGISGEAAKQVGLLMKELSHNHQLLVVSHQPQVAAKASTHYYVYKKEVNSQVSTFIDVLKPDERILALARMMSGEKPTDTAIANAREMLLN